jgi:TPR repeat protein
MQVAWLEWTAKSGGARAVRSSPAEQNDAVLPAAATAKLAPDRTAKLIKRGLEFLKDGDFAAARLMLRPAADAGDAQAALLLGATFDPLVLAELGVFGLRPDPVAARAWYQRAAEFGSADASGRIDRLAQGK